MDLQPQLILELAALGICTGFLAGLLGIGGGMVMVPFITFMLSQRGVDADLAHLNPRLRMTALRLLADTFYFLRPVRSWTSNPN